MEVGTKVLDDADEIMFYVEKSKPIWGLLPGGLLSQLPIGLILDLSKKGLLVAPTDEETFRLQGPQKDMGGHQ